MQDLGYKHIPCLRLTKKDIEKIHAYRDSPVFWVKKINKTIAQNRDILASKTGIIGKNKESTHVTDATLREFKKSFLKQENFRQNKVVVNSQTGDYFQLSDTKRQKDTSVIEAICILNGLNRYAIKVGYACAFITITLPPSKHVKNENSSLGPIELNEYFKKKWSIYNNKRAQWVSASYIFRVIEAHSDGTPHWHLIMFYPKEFRIQHRYELFAAFRLKTSTKRKTILWEDIPLPKDNPSGSLVEVESIGYLVGKIKHEFQEGLDIKRDNSNAVNASYMTLWGFNNYDFFGIPRITRSLWRELRSDHYPELPQELQQVREQILNNKLTDFSNFADFFDFLVKNTEHVEIVKAIITPNKTPSIIGIKWKNIVYPSNRQKYDVMPEDQAIQYLEEKTTSLTLNKPSTSDYERLLMVLTQIQLLKMNVSDGLPAVEHNENYVDTPKRLKIMGINENYVDTSKRLKSETSLFLKKFLNLVKIIYRVIFLKPAGLIFSKVAPFFK